MNLSLSSKIRQMNPRSFFTDREKNPCWYVIVERGEKRKQIKWKVGVKFRGETEEYVLGASYFDTADDAVWNKLNSQQFAQELLEAFRFGGKKAAKEWLKEE